MIRRVFIVAVAVLAGAARAQTRPADLIRHTTQTPGAAHSGSSDLLRTLIALAIVVAGICVLRWLLKKFSPGAVARSGQGVRIVSRTAISPRQNVVLLHVGRRVLVVAEGAQQTSTLCEITDAIEVAEILGEGEAPAEPKSPRENFATVLRRVTPNDVGLSTTQEDLSGLIKKVRILSQHFKRA